MRRLFATLLILCALCVSCPSFSGSEFTHSVVIAAKVNGVIYQGSIKARTAEDFAPVGMLTVKFPNGVFKAPCVYADFHENDVTLWFESGDTFLILNAQDFDTPDRLYPIFLLIIEGRQTFGGWEFGLGLPVEPLPMAKEAVRITGVL